MSENFNSKKIHFLLFFLTFFVVAFIIVIIAFLSKTSSDQKAISLKTTKTDYAIRGNIYSSDGFTLATSEKLYKVSINPKSIDPNKKELFVNLFSIYSGIQKYIILDKLNNSTYTTLSYNISPLTAANLKLLNLKLNRYQVFQEYEKNGRVIQKMGIDISLSGYSRKYPYGDTMEPILGYTQKNNNQKITKVIGVKGSEKFNEKYLISKQDEILTGPRDVGSTIIQNKDSHFQQKEDGLNITLTIPLILQKKIEKMITENNQKLKAKEILVGIMDSKTGRILSLATSKRFDPKNIRQEDYSALNASAIELSFEPGSIIKPIIYAILLQNNLISPNEKIFLNNGIYKLGRHTIKDDHPLKSATPREILLYSSNIGMVKLTQALNSKIFLTALQDYGFGKQTQIDLPQEAKGILPGIDKLKGSYKASVSYGYGFRATFIQLLRAYASFSNGGYLVTPRTIDYLRTSQEERYKIKTPSPIQIISTKTALEIQSILSEIIEKGTGKNAYIPNLKMGGKTGTARIFINGEYAKRYNSSFFGFVEDNKRSYTIGVVIFDPNVKGGYYGSKTAAPIFKEIVQLLIKEKYLKPSNQNPKE